MSQHTFIMQNTQLVLQHVQPTGSGLFRVTAADASPGKTVEESNKWLDDEHTASKHPHPDSIRSLQQTCLQRAQLENTVTLTTVCLINTSHSWIDKQDTIAFSILVFNPSQIKSRSCLPDAGERRTEASMRACAGSNPLRKFLQRACSWVTVVTQNDARVIATVTDRTTCVGKVWEVVVQIA